MKISEDVINGWRAVRLSSGDLSLGLVPQIGGRIMSLRFQGDEIFYVHEPQKGRVYDFSQVEDIIEAKRQAGFPLFGGNKTWVAPETEWVNKAPSIELDAGAYQFEPSDNGCVMTSPVCRETGLRIIRRVTLGQAGVIHLSEEFENCSGRELRRGIWSVTQLKRPFIALVPEPVANMRSYHCAGSELCNPGTLLQRHTHFTLGQEWVEVRCEDATLFKVGGIPATGQILSLCDTGHGVINFEKTFLSDPQSEYAHASSIEVFNSHLFSYGEVEVHAPLKVLKPGERQVFEQTWRVSLHSEPSVQNFHI